MTVGYSCGVKCFVRGSGAVLAVAVVLAAHAAHAAEAYPVRPVRLIAAFSPGGFVDFTARVIAAPLGVALGQQVLVENRAGAGGIVGTEAAARAAPDGYTMTIGSVGTHAVNQSLYPKLPYHVLRDSSRSHAWPTPRAFSRCIRRCRRAT